MKIWYLRKKFIAYFIERKMGKNEHVIEDIFAELGNQEISFDTFKKNISRKKIAEQ